MSRGGVLGRKRKGIGRHHVFWRRGFVCEALRISSTALEGSVVSATGAEATAWLSFPVPAWTVVSRRELWDSHQCVNVCLLLFHFSCSYFSFRHWLRLVLTKTWQVASKATTKWFSKICFHVLYLLINDFLSHRVSCPFSLTPCYSATF